MVYSSFLSFLSVAYSKYIRGTSIDFYFFLGRAYTDILSNAFVIYLNQSPLLTYLSLTKIISKRRVRDVTENSKIKLRKVPAEVTN